MYTFHYHVDDVAPHMLNQTWDTEACVGALAWTELGSLANDSLADPNICPGSTDAMHSRSRSASMTETWLTNLKWET